jgi:GT2 family glycosyltransferase
MPDHHAGLLAALPGGLTELDGETAAVARALFAPQIYGELALPSENDPDRLWEHFVRNWVPGDRFPSLFFDPDYYAQKVSNGEAPPLEPGESIFLHWLCRGLPRRVVPTPRFDEEFYHREHPDIAAWGTFGFAHFVQHGLREGRRPTAWFEPRFYSYELGSAARTETAYVHFLTYGIKAALAANEGLARFLEWRDCAMTPAQYDHLLFASSGWSRNLSAEGLKFLLALYVPESHRNHSGVDDVTELAAYLQHGIASGVPPGPLFDANEYSLLHWLADGVDKRIVPTARFDEGFYLKTYPDIARASLWSFAHFICHGAFEGRSPNASFPAKRELSGRTRGLPLCYRSWIRADFGAAEPPKTHGGEPARAHPPARSESAAIEDWNQRTRSRRPDETPAVSVLVLAQDDRDATIRCIASIAADFPSCDAEFVVVDDGSSDGTAEAVARLAGVDCVRNDRKQGLAKAYNRGAGVARGKYLCFLHDVAELFPGALDRLVTTAEEDDAVGIVGAKLIRPDGRLEAAGGIIWRDGTQSSYGRFDRPDGPQYAFLRDVDYAGDSALVVRAELFRRLGGFSEDFGVSDYASSDLCLGVRSLGYRVVYQPLSEVLLRDDSTSSRRERARAGKLAETTQAKFCKKWASQLRGHLESPANVHSAARRINRQHVVLMLDSYAAPLEHEPRSRRLTDVAKILRQIGYSVVVLPFGSAEPPYARELQQLGVEVLYGIEGGGGRSWAEVFDDVTLLPDLAWISSPHLLEAYESLLHRKGQTKVIYDTLGHHDARKRRDARLGSDETKWLDWERMELDCAARADATVVATEGERQALEAAGAREVYVVPDVHQEAVSGQRDYEESTSPESLEAHTLWTVELRIRELLGRVRRRSAAKTATA